MKNMKIALFNFMSFVSIALIQSQLIVYLKNSGYDELTRGWILGAGAIMSVIFSTGLGLWSDTTGKMKPGYMISMLLYGIISCTALLIENGWIKVICIILLIGLIRQLMSSSETWVLQLKPSSFGQYHCFAAIGLISSSLLSGYLFSQTNYIWAAICCVFFSLFSIICAYQMEETANRKKTDKSWKGLFELVQNKIYMKLILVLLLLMMIGFADQFVVIEKLLSLDSSPHLVSWKFALQSLAEIPLYLISKRLFEKIDATELLFAATIMSGIKFMLYSFFQTPWSLVLTALLQVCTHPLILLSSKLLIQRITPEHLHSTSQMLGFALYFGLAGFITPLLSSYLIPMIGYDSLLRCFAFSAVIPLLIEFMMKKQLKCDTLFK